MGLLKDQDEDCVRLVCSLYSKGLTQSQVSDVFVQVYGKQYSTSSISRTLDGIKGLDEALALRFPETPYSAARSI